MKLTIMDAGSSATANIQGLHPPSVQTNIPLKIMTKKQTLMIEKRLNHEESLTYRNGPINKPVALNGGQIKIGRQRYECA